MLRPKMLKPAIIGLIAIVVLLVGASAVFAQDSTQTTPGAAVAPICPIGGTSAQQMHDAMGQNGIEGMQQMHDAMGQNVPEGMQQMHDAMGQALQSGDTAQIQQMHNTCQSRHNVQQ